MAPLPPFERVVADHGAVVLRVCTAHAGPNLADEVFQETMLAALRAYPELRDPRAVRRWLCSIAIRKAIDAHRATARRASPIDHAELVAVADDSAVPETDPIADAVLWDRVRVLPPKQRAAVTLRYLADLSHAEIGDALDISADAARRNVFEALAQLRTAVAADLTSEQAENVLRP